jgi:hypothetical protein
VARSTQQAGGREAPGLRENRARSEKRARQQISGYLYRLSIFAAGLNSREITPNEETVQAPRSLRVSDKWEHPGDSGRTSTLARYRAARLTSGGTH